MASGMGTARKSTTRQQHGVRSGESSSRRRVSFGESDDDDEDEYEEIPSSNASRRTTTSSNDVPIAIDEGNDPMEDDDDDEPTESERRIIRNQYRNLIEETVQNELEPSIGTLNSTLKEAEKLFSRVKMPREARLDSKLLSACANLGRQRAQALHSSIVTFSPIEFAEKLNLFIASTRARDEPECAEPRPSGADWTRLGEMYSHLMRAAPSFTAMLGAIDRDEPQPVQKQRQRRKDDDPHVKAVRPQAVTEMGKSDQETTTEEVERVLAILQVLYRKNGGPMCYVEFVTDPNSFARTVENVFHVSFLIKDGLAELSLDDDGLPVIAPVIRREGDEEPLAAKTNELAMVWTMEDWEECIKTFDITRAAIPPRSKQATTSTQ